MDVNEEIDQDVRDVVLQMMQEVARGIEIEHIAKQLTNTAITEGVAEVLVNDVILPCAVHKVTGVICAPHGDNRETHPQLKEETIANSQSNKEALHKTNMGEQIYQDEQSMVHDTLQQAAMEVEQENIAQQLASDAITEAMAEVLVNDVVLPEAVKNGAETGSRNTHHGSSRQFIEETSSNKKEAFGKTKMDENVYQDVQTMVLDILQQAAMEVETENIAQQLASDAITEGLAEVLVNDVVLPGAVYNVTETESCDTHRASKVLCRQLKEESSSNKKVREDRKNNDTSNKRSAVRKEKSMPSLTPCKEQSQSVHKEELFTTHSEELGQSSSLYDHSALISMTEREIGDIINTFKCYKTISLGKQTHMVESSDVKGSVNTEVHSFVPPNSTKTLSKSETLPDYYRLFSNQQDNIELQVQKKTASYASEQPCDIFRTKKKSLWRNGLGAVRRCFVNLICSHQPAASS